MIEARPRSLLRSLHRRHWEREVDSKFNRRACSLERPTLAPFFRDSPVAIVVKTDPEDMFACVSFVCCQLSSITSRRMTEMAVMATATEIHDGTGNTLVLRGQTILFIRAINKGVCSAFYAACCMCCALMFELFVASQSQ